MDNFCQFWNKVNGEPYTDGVPAPTEYKLNDIGKSGGHELTPLTDEDMFRYSDDDVAAEMEKMKTSGFNPTKLGAPMSDEEFNNFHGLKLRQ